MRDGAPDGVRCIEAQVMDLSDDIAYSVHDFEDAIVSGYLDVPALSARADHDDLVDSMFEWIGGEIDHDGLIAAFDRLDNLAYWIDSWDGSRRDLARLKNLTSPADRPVRGRVGARHARGAPRGARSPASPPMSWCRPRPAPRSPCSRASSRRT